MVDATKPPDQPARPPDSPDAEPIWNFLGLRIARKTEIIALVAFILSASGVIWQIIIYTRGAVVTLFPTDQIVLAATDKLGRNYSGEDSLLALIATMSYVNDGEAGQNAIIRREYISFALGASNIEHRWYEFGSSDVENIAQTFKRDSEARPFPVAASSATSHETLFAPWEIDCSAATTPCNAAKNFVKWSDFISAIKTNPSITFTTQADVYPSKRIAATCTAQLRGWEIDILEKEKWLTAACVDASSSDRRQRKAPTTGSTLPKK
jgi:hypothetical protein